MSTVLQLLFLAVGVHGVYLLAGRGPAEIVAGLLGVLFAELVNDRAVAERLVGLLRRKPKV